MPYLKNGNCKDYLQENPNADRLQIVSSTNMLSALAWSHYDAMYQLYEISLGLVHLHSIRIVHGDLKGVSFLMYRTTHALLCA